MPGASVTGGAVVVGACGAGAVFLAPVAARRIHRHDRRSCRKLRNGQPQGFHFLRQPRNAHRVLVDAFTDDAQVGAELIDGELLIGERLAGRGRLFIHAAS